MKLIRSSNSPQYIIVDEAMYTELSQFKWAVNNSGYVSSNIHGINKSMTEYIMGRRDGFTVDHINRDRLDNRKCNLRFLSHSLNCMNSGPRKFGSSKYKGVSYYKRNGKWQAQVKMNGKYQALGYFSTERDAALAYNEWVLTNLGETFYLNELND